VDRIYQDLGKREELQLVRDAQAEPAQYLLIRRLEELGDSLQEVSDRVTELEALGVQLLIEQPYNSSQLRQDPYCNIRTDCSSLFQEIQRDQRSRQSAKGTPAIALCSATRESALRLPTRQDKYVLDRSAPQESRIFLNSPLWLSARAVRYLAQKYGKKISVSTGRRWLTNPVYRGNTAYQNGQVISIPCADHLREEAAQVDRLLRRKSPATSYCQCTSFFGWISCLWGVPV